ncbi:MAG: alpha/beta fold hydrolase [Bacteroidia bacterium]
MYHLTSDKKKLYYEEKGQINSNNVLVFLNGLTQSTLSWSLITPKFERDNRIICLDFIFQGLSEKEGDARSFDQHASDLNSLLEHLSIKKATIIGLSYGSLVAQHFAVNHPEKCQNLVLISTFAHKTPMFEIIEQSWWNALKRGGYCLMFDTMMPFVLSEEYFSNPLIPVEFLKKSREDLNQNADAIFKLMQATKERKDYRKELESINCPTLIIQGEKDLLLPINLASEVHFHIKNSKFISIPNAGHTLNLEHTEEVIDYLKQFLRKNGN